MLQYIAAKLIDLAIWLERSADAHDAAAAEATAEQPAEPIEVLEREDLTFPEITWATEMECPHCEGAILMTEDIWPVEDLN